MNQILLRINQIKEIIKLSIGMIKSKNIRDEMGSWLICERGTDARDNGFAIFRYLTDKTDEKNVYYLISRGSADIKKFKKDDKLVFYGSALHYKLLFSAKYILFAHVDAYFPHMDYMFGIIQKFQERMTAKLVFLQHGIIKNYHSCFCYPAFKVDLFICGAKPEYDYILKNFNQPTGVACYSGLARYDNLVNFKTKRQILLMPTWRTYLSDCSDEEFCKSKFFVSYQELINDVKLNFLLEKHDLVLVFYIHEELQKYLHLFSKMNDRIVLASSDKYDVQPLLKESKILITDYSSVYFDFGYMRKPIIFFQFDSKEFLSGHYEKGYFDYHTMGFGPVVEEKDDVVFALENDVLNNFKVESVYKSRRERFFTYDDSNNCKRIYKAIKKLR